MSDTEQALEWYVAFQLGKLSNRGLISRCQDALVALEVPSWVTDIACLDEIDLLDAERILESHLFEKSVLPDSQPLRDHIRVLVLDWADTQAHRQAVEMNGVTATVVPILHLLPNYQMTSIYVPIEEYPYPACNVQTRDELVRYIRENIDRIVPRYAT